MTMNLNAHIDAELSATQLAELADRLTDKRRELSERVTALEQQVTTRDDCSLADAADAASLQETRLRAQAMVVQQRQIIGEIDAAFRRLETGNYGVSETTGEPIVYERLALIPWARTGSDD